MIGRFVLRSLAVLATAPIALPATAQTVSVHEFGHLADGRTVHEFTMDSGNGLRVRLLDYGGIVRAIETPDSAGHSDNIALSLATLADHERRPNFGAIIGRYVNRLSGGGLTIDGVFHPLAVNAKGIITHGGTAGFGAQLWTGERIPMPDRAAVRLRLVSPSGQNGFPGTLDTRVTFSVGRDQTLRIDYRATTDAPTVLNLTHHAFFNLAGAASGSADRHWIRVFADRFTPLDVNRVPTGVLQPVNGTPFDLRDWAELGARERSPDPQMVAGHGFDTNFVLSRKPGAGLPLAACVYDPATGRALVLRTDQPGVQLYSGNGFDGSLAGASGHMLRQGDGFALETQHFADSPRHPNFPSTLLRPGAAFATSTSFTFVAAPPRPSMRSSADIPAIPQCQ